MAPFEIVRAKKKLPDLMRRAPNQIVLMWSLCPTELLGYNHLFVSCLIILVWSSTPFFRTYSTTASSKIVCFPNINKTTWTLVLLLQIKLFKILLASNEAQDPWLIVTPFAPAQGSMLSPSIWSLPYGHSWVKILLPYIFSVHQYLLLIRYGS